MLAAHADGVAGAAGRGRRILRGHERGNLRLWPFLGPAFIACIAYIDPGNFATNVAGGSKFGYTLLWVIVASNLMAMLIQTLSAKLGIATGRNLPEVCRDRFSRRTAIALWLQAEVIAMATDLAEFLGAAKLGQVGRHRDHLGLEPQRDRGPAREPVAADLGQVATGGDAELRRERLDEHGHQVRGDDHPEQRVAELRAPRDVRG